MILLRHTARFRECLLVHHFKWRLASLLHLLKYVPANSGPDLLRGETTMCLKDDFDDDDMNFCFSEPFFLGIFVWQSD